MAQGRKWPRRRARNSNFGAALPDAIGDQATFNAPAAGAQPSYSSSPTDASPFEASRRARAIRKVSRFRQRYPRRAVRWQARRKPAGGEKLMILGLSMTFDLKLRITCTE